MNRINQIDPKMLISKLFDLLNKNLVGVKKKKVRNKNNIISELVPILVQSYNFISSSECLFMFKKPFKKKRNNINIFLIIQFIIKQF